MTPKPLIDPPVPAPPTFGPARARSVTVIVPAVAGRSAATVRQRIVVSLPLRSPRATAATPPPPQAQVVADAAIAPGGALAAVLDAIRAGAYVCLDSNLWMTPRCYPAITRFLQLLGERGTPLRLSGEQLAEIDHLRKGPRQAERSLAARAIRAITDFAKLGWLVIDPVEDRRAHHDFDSYLVKRAQSHLQTHAQIGRVIVATGDVPLSGRLHSVRTELKRSADHLQVLSHDDFLALMADA
jgi:hypothetical protein